MDKIFFGDNQFFGINHASEEKALQQSMKFQDTQAIADTLHVAYEAGVHGFMCTTHERMADLIEVVRAEGSRWDKLSFYPGMPYAHKYANAVTELGYINALKSFLPNTGLLDTMWRGGKAIVTQDVASIASLLIDAEMKAFDGLNTPIIFLQNVVTDLILGLGYHEAFKIFADHIKMRYNAEAGFFTMNLPMLLPALANVGINNPIVCANVNKAEFRMSGGIESYREATRRHPAQVIAMSVLASGVLPAREAIQWVLDEPYVESILFGASSRKNIEETVQLIHELSQ